MDDVTAVGEGPRRELHPSASKARNARFPRLRRRRLHPRPAVLNHRLHPRAQSPKNVRTVAWMPRRSPPRSSALLASASAPGSESKRSGTRLPPIRSTSKSNPFSNIQSQQDSARREALISDIGFAVGGAGLITAAILYFAREKDKPATTVPTTEVGSAHFTGISPAASPHGATLFLGGEF